MRRRHPATTAAILVGAAVLLAGCTGTPAPKTSAAVSAPADSSAVSPGSASGSASPAPLTCDTMIPAETVQAFKASGWSGAPGPLYVGDARVAGGLQCTWGKGEASSTTDIFGRGAIGAQAAADAEKQLVAQGWRRIDSPEGVYITAGKDMILNPDDEGYGMTYLFGDGWVKVASTKQGILLVTDPS